MQQADLAINDGQSTPVLKTFKARGVKTDLALWLDMSNGVDIGLPSITQSTRKRTKGGAPANVTEVRILTPVLKAISGSDGGYTPQPAVSHTPWAKLELIGPVVSSAAERKNLFAYVKNLFALPDASNPVYQAYVNFDSPT